MAERFPRMHVTQVDFDERNLHAQQCIAQRHAGVRESGGIEDDAGDVRGRRIVNAADDLSLGIALERRQMVARFRRQLSRAVHDLLASVADPYVPGSRMPSRFRLGPLRSSR